MPEEIDEIALEEPVDEVEPEASSKKPSKREKLEKKRKIEDYLDQLLPLDVLSITALLIIETQVLLSLPRNITYYIRTYSA